MTAHVKQPDRMVARRRVPGACSCGQPWPCPEAARSRKAAPGPFETEREARAYAGNLREDRDLAAANLAMLTSACEAAGVTLGGYDDRIVRWLAGWEPATCAVVAGLIGRAHETGRNEADRA